METTKNLAVALQGQAGSYHQQAAQEYFGAQVRLCGCDTFDEVFRLLLEGRADRAVVAVRNSIFGPIGEVQALLTRHAARVRVVGEVTVPVHHCLIGLPGATLPGITTVHSQYMALGQCLRFLQTQLPQAQLVGETDTAASVALIKQRGDAHAAAVASAAAARLHGLPVLRENIEDDPNNTTTFAVLRTN